MTSIMMKIPGMQLVQIPVTKNQQGEIVLPPQDNALRVIQLEQNLKFLQEQQQFMLAGLHREIEVLHKRNRDLQFQLVFSKGKHVTGTVTSPVSENITAKRSVNEERLEKEAAVAKGAARSAEARALQLQQLLEAQTEKLKCLQLQQQQEAVGGGVVGAFGLRGAGREGALAARLEEAERLVRRLRAEGELQRREVQPGLPAAGATGVTNLLFDHSTAHRLYLQAIKNSLTLGMRASTVDNGGFGSRRYRPQNYQFPPLHTGHDYWYSGQRERKSSKNGAKVDSLENRIFGLEQDSEKTSMLPNLMLKTRIPMVHAGKSDSFTNMYVSCRTLASDIDYQDTARHNNGRNRRLTPPMTLPDLQNSHHQSTVYANSNSRLHNPGYQKHKHETKVKSPELVSTDEENPARRPKASIPSDFKSTDEQSTDTQRANHRSRGRRNQQQR